MFNFNIFSKKVSDQYERNNSYQLEESRTAVIGIPIMEANEKKSSFIFNYTPSIIDRGTSLKLKMSNLKKTLFSSIYKNNNNKSKYQEYNSIKKFIKPKYKKYKYMEYSFYKNLK